MADVWLESWRYVHIRGGHPLTKNSSLSTFFFGFSFFGILIEPLEQVLRIAPITAFGTFHIYILSSPQQLQT